MVELSSTNKNFGVGNVKMAAPLMSLLSPGTIKHVVPWRNRSEFLSVYNDLYSDDISLQEKAINKIAVWKSRAGSKLSVAVESSGMLMQAHLEHSKCKLDGTLNQKESHLRYIYSLALIRFVNHVTEKGQTKATAQPVHLVAREFGIPEWIVRLRHDATHSSIPCLDSLATGAQWSLNYLKDNFWQLQTKDNNVEEKEHSVKQPKISDIRRAFYDFQKSRFEEINAEEKDKDKQAGDQSETIKVLHRYLNQNRLRFVKCLLEDGILISTEEQLAAMGVSSEDLLSRSPPTVPIEMAVFWKPLLKKLNNAGALSFMLNVAIFSVTSGEGLRNYQLVAWIAYILSQCLVSTRKYKRRSRKIKKESIFKSTVFVATKTLLVGCLQNINKLTAHLLKYLGKESLGEEEYAKLMKLLSLHSLVDDFSSSEGSDSDTVYTVEDIKKAKVVQSSKLSSKISCDIKGGPDTKISWSLCTDIVDWSTVPIGVVPDPASYDDEEEDDTNEEAADKIEDAADDHSSTQSSDDDDADEYVGSRRKGSGKKRNSDSKEDSDASFSVKRSRLVLDDDHLI